MSRRTILLFVFVFAPAFLTRCQIAEGQVVVYQKDPIAERMAVQLDAYRFQYLVAKEKWTWRLEVAERHREELDRYRADLKMAGDGRITAARQARDSRESRDWEVGGYGVIFGSFYARQNDRITLKTDSGKLVFVSFRHLGDRDQDYIQSITVRGQFVEWLGDGKPER